MAKGANVGITSLEISILGLIIVQAFFVWVALMGLLEFKLADTNSFVVRAFTNFTVLKYGRCAENRNEHALKVGYAILLALLLSTGITTLGSICLEDDSEHCVYDVSTVDLGEVVQFGESLKFDGTVVRRTVVAKNDMFADSNIGSAVVRVISRKQEGEYVMTTCPVFIAEGVEIGDEVNFTYVSMLDLNKRTFLAIFATLVEETGVAKAD